MPGVQADLIVRDRATGTINKVTGSIRRMEQTTVAGSRRMNAGLASIKQHWLGISVALAGATIALTRVWASAKRGATFEEDMGRLNTQLAKFDTTAAKLIPRMIQVANGQLSMAEAASVASRAIAAGLSTEGIETFVRLADTLGDVMGTSLPEAFDKLTKAAATGRGTVLKQLGIYLDLELEVDKLAKSLGITTTQISEQTKATIGLNKILEQAEGAIAKFASSSLSDIDKMTAVEKRFDDLTLAAGRFFQTVVVRGADVVEGATEIVSAYNKVKSAAFGIKAPFEEGEIFGPGRAQFEAFKEQQVEIRNAQREATSARLLELQAFQEEQSGLQIRTAATRQQKEFAEIRLTLEREITSEIARQNNIIAGVSASRAAFERERADVRFQRLDPEEKLQSLRRQVSAAGDDAEKLQRILRQTEALGELPGAERLVRFLEDKIPTAFDRTERAAKESLEELEKLLKPVESGTLEVTDAVEALAAVLRDASPANSPFLATLDQLAIKAQTAADRVEAALAAIRGAEPGGGGGTGGGPGFQTGSSRIGRSGLAFLHRGEAVIPQSQNFLDPALSRMERAERLAKLAVGRIPAFADGTSAFSGGGVDLLKAPPNLFSQGTPGAGGSQEFFQRLFGGGGVVGGTGQALRGFGSLAGLELLRSGGSLPEKFFFDPNERLNYLQGKYEQLINEMNVFRFRTKPENFINTLGFLRVTQETQTANNAFVGLTAQLRREIREAQNEIFKQGLGTGSGPGGFTVNVNIGGGFASSPDLVARAIRDAVLPEFRRLSQLGGQRLF